MIIQKMNNVLVKHSKILFGIFTFVIIISFVWFFTPGVDGSLLFGGRASGKTTYGTVFGEKVTYNDVQTSMRQLSLLIPLVYNGYPGMDVPEAIAFQFSAEKVAAAKLGCSVSDAELANFTRDLPFFKENNVFSRKKYDEYIAKTGYSVSDLEEALRVFYLTKVKVPELLGSAVTVSDAEFQLSLKSMFEKFSFRTIVFSPEAYLDAVKFTDQELRDLYDSNPAAFLPAPQSSGLVAVALYDAFKPVVPEATMKEYYAKHQDQFKDKDGKVKPFEAVKKEVEDAVAGDKSLAAANVTDVFHKTLRKMAQDPESKYKENSEAIFREEAKKAGLLVIDVKALSADNAAVADRRIEDTIVSALLTLKNPGSLTNRVKGEKAAFVALLTDRKVFTEATFEQCRAAVEKQLRYNKAKDLVASAAEKFRKDVAASKTPAADLEKLAEAAKAKVIPSPAPQPRLMLEQRADKQFIFETKPGTLSAPVRQDGFELMIFLDSRTPAAEADTAKFAMFYRAGVLNQKQSAAYQEYLGWVMSNCQLMRPVQERRQQAQ